MSSPRKNETQIIKSEQAVQRHPKGFRLLYDDFLEPNLFNGLRDLITDNSFPWNYRLGVVLKKDWDYEPTEDWALSHLVWHGHSGVVSPMSYELQPYMTSIFQQLDIEIPCRIKFNLGIRRNTNYEKVILIIRQLLYTLMTVMDILNLKKMGLLLNQKQIE